MKNTKGVMVFCFLVIFLGGATVGFPEEFPRRTIRVIIPFSAGGALDILARAFQKPFERELGTKTIIECLPGGSTKVGTIEVMKAKPDGYTVILLGPQSWVNLYYSKAYDFRVWEKMSPVGNLTEEPAGFVGVRNESPHKTWADLIKYAKEHPGKLSCGGPAAGGIMELIHSEITKAAGIETKYVPFAGASPMNIALLGGHVEFQVCSLVDAAPMIKAGQTRGLAISTDQRVGIVPKVPTFQELGIGESLTLKKSMWGPPNLSPKIVKIITDGIKKATADPDFANFVENQLMGKVDYKTPDKTKEDLMNYEKKYGPKLTAAYK